MDTNAVLKLAIIPGNQDALEPLGARPYENTPSIGLAHRFALTIFPSMSFTIV